MANELNPTDEWNNNQGWIEYLNQLIAFYGMQKFEKNYEGMYDCLVIIENTISPKIERDQVETNLDIIKVNLRKMIVRGNDGNIVKYYPQMIDKTIDLLDETYRLIIMKMDAAGILTKKPKDPKKAFGNFAGS